MDWVPSISGYTTTYNCISQEYPYEQSIKSMLGFCQEVIVLDGGSDDGTFERLLEISETEPLLKLFQNKVDWTAKRHAVHDGLQKAVARSYCTMKYCWQMDGDEVVHEDHYEAIVKLCRQFPKFVDLISLPVIEYWGSIEKVRMDINPWKWRLSRNKKTITHGIPKHLRKQDDDGNLYASPGTDGCDYIDSETFEQIPHANFYTPDAHQVKQAAITDKNKEAFEQYQKWFNNVVDMMPGVFHYSWFDIERKIKTYKNYWQCHWESLYDITQEDTAENNKFFNKPWSEVSEEDIKILALKLSDEMGGWVFHSKVDFTNPTPAIKINKNPPAVMNGQTENTSSDMQLQS
jgi:glycosyltransferase involved in cell wall biosynthesis